jgi:hypothetical protein
LLSLHTTIVAGLLDIMQSHHIRLTQTYQRHYSTLSDYPGSMLIFTQ